MKIGYKKGFRNGYDEGYTAGHSQAEIESVSRGTYPGGLYDGYETVLRVLKKIKSPDDLAEVVDEIEVVLAQAASGQ